MIEPDWTPIIEGIIALGTGSTVSVHVVQLFKKLPSKLVDRYKCTLSLIASGMIAFSGVSNIPALSTINSSSLHEALVIAGTILVTAWTYNTGRGKDKS